MITVISAKGHRHIGQNETEDIIVTYFKFNERTTTVSNYHPDDFRELCLLLELGARKTEEHIEIAPRLNMP
jgi:hypothetical protein